MTMTSSNASRAGGAPMKNEPHPDPATYGAVLYLRRHGHVVHSHDARRDLHQLDGAIVPASWLRDMAVVEGWRSEGGHR